MAHKLLQLRGIDQAAQLQPKPKRRSPGQRARRTGLLKVAAVASVIAMLDGIPASTDASTLTWDSDATASNGVTDGGGSWDTSISEWYNGSTDAAWVNSNNDTAVFGNGGTTGTNPYTVTLGGNITVGGLTFNTSSTASGYTIAGGNNTLSFGGSGATDLITTNSNATISAALAATGSVTTLQKAGSGILQLSGGGTFSTAINSGPSTGSLFITGGTFTVGGMDFWDAGSDNNTTDGVVFQTGGAVITSKDWDGRNKTSSYDISGGTLTAATPNRIRCIGTFNASGNATVTFNTPDARISSDGVAGTLSISGNASVTVATTSFINLANGAGTGTLNLDGGTLTTAGVIRGDNTNTVVNFNGGTLKASGAGSSGIILAAGSVNIYGGGAVIDTNNNTTGISQALLGTTGNGVDTVTVNAGGSYTTAPTVTFSAPTSGTTAKGYALINTSGAVTSIVITNPGSGYTSSAPTVTFGSGAASATSTSNLNNANGGLTKLNTGTLTLSAASNTYTGATIINAGTLKLSPASGTNNIANSSSINVVSGATLDVTAVPSNAFAVAPGQSLFGNGNVSGTMNVSGNSTATAIISAGAGATIGATPGTLNTGALTFGASGLATGDNGEYLFKLASAGTAGSIQTGGNATTWDQISASTLTVTAGNSTTSTGAFTIAPTGNLSAVASGNYSWAIAQIGTGNTTISINGNTTSASSSPISSSVFALNTSGLTVNSVPDPSSSFFSVYFETVGSNNDLVLSYNGTPEPGTALLALAGSMPMLLARRRRQKSLDAGSGSSS